MKLSQRLALFYIKTKIKLLSAISKKKAARYVFRLFCTPPRKFRPGLPPVFENAEKLTLEIEGLNIQGWRWNHPSETKLLIIHGFESASVNFERYIKLFIQKGYEVLAFDAPAHGMSEGKQVTAPMYAEMIRRINAEFGTINRYLAHSFGGLTLSLALESIPHSTEDRVVLIAPATETTTAVEGFFRMLDIPDSLRQPFSDRIIELGGHPMEWYSISRAIKNFRCRVLWIHDENDDTTPIADAEAVKNANHPHVEFVITRGLGHRRIYRDQGVVNRVTSFL